MPLLEAFHHGTPVLCSNTTSLPEVGGDAVLACDPTDESAMAGLMKTIMTDPGLRDRFRKKPSFGFWRMTGHSLPMLCALRWIGCREIRPNIRRDSRWSAL